MVAKPLTKLSLVMDSSSSTAVMLMPTRSVLKSMYGEAFSSTTCTVRARQSVPLQHDTRASLPKPAKFMKMN